MVGRTMGIFLFSLLYFCHVLVEFVYVYKLLLIFYVILTLLCLLSIGVL